MSESLHIALLGAGQLGSAFALALRASDPAIRVTAYDPVPAHAAHLLESGGATATASSAHEAVADCDLVIFAAPVRSFRRLAEEIKPALRDGTIITDLGSVKASMLAVIEQLPNARVVPAHPIAGSEKSGPAAARADLFKGKLCIITPNDATDKQAIEIVETLWHLAGADVLPMPIAVHDHIYAAMSHLPHLVAFVAADYFHNLGVHVTPDDAVLQRFLRISRSNPRMWSDIFLENREALLPALGTFTAILRHVAGELRSGKEDSKTLTTAEIAKAYVPRMLASCLISTVSTMEQQLDMSLKPFGAGGMRDIAAPAADDPEHAMEEISTVARAVADVIDVVLAKFNTLAQAIGAEDEPAMLYAITKMVANAHEIVEVRQ